MENNNNSRRKFLQQLSATALLMPLTSLAAFSREELESRIIPYERKYSPNDNIRVACIGMGIMGFGDVKTAIRVPGVEMVAACDLYDGRLERAKEVFGKDIYTTRDFHKILGRKDIDAVIIATSDHWHDHISIEAMKKGKAVYCEKPMVQHLNEGWPVINTQHETNAVFQVGSQRVSSIAMAKAKELYKAGEIGKLNVIEASFDRQSALGAWQYTMPPDASPKTVDWDRYLGDAPKRPWDPKRFFWWRNYKDYGTGVAGDLFVHLISGIHFITDSKGPEKIFSTGGLNYWKDGRDVPDVMTAILDYPETQEHPAFQVMLRVNFISGAGEKGVTRLIGSEGVIDFGWNDFTLTKSKMPEAPGYDGWDSFNTYPEKMQKEIVDEYNRRWTKDQQAKPPSTKPIVFKAPNGYDERLDHFMNFFESMRNKKPLVEDAVFGFRAAAPALACNESYFQKKIIYWDPVNMKVKNV
ncbi:MAG: Gfo/Idh/MocA family oxidoreductase [Chitinophagaceae bacterium]|nr:Gfo/Idh/MocA family oxidoreductase [Chitinophagaceae bacterium]